MYELLSYLNHLALLFSTSHSIVGAESGSEALSDQPAADQAAHPVRPQPGQVRRVLRHPRPGTVHSRISIPRRRRRAGPGSEMREERLPGRQARPVLRVQVQPPPRVSARFLVPLHQRTSHWVSGKKSY